MFRYLLSRDTSDKTFYHACDEIEEKISNLTKEKLVEDVDGSLVQVYMNNAKKIVAINDYEIGVVYVESELDLQGVLSGILSCQQKY